MTDYLLEKKTDLIAIADAIRNKTASTSTMKITEMPSLISSIASTSDVVIGDKKVFLGEFTPTSAGGEYGVKTGLPSNSSIYLIAFWIKDISVISKYANDTIMVNSIKFSSQYSTLSYITKSGELNSQVKSQFGIVFRELFTFLVASHDNWKIQPETYQYIIVYS